MALRLLLVDDHRLVTDSLSRYLHELHDFDVRSASELAAGLALLGEDHTFDVVLIDVVMPGVSGLAGIEAAIKAADPAPVIVFSGNVNEESIRKSLQRGARGFIPKSFPLKALATAIELVAGGEVFVPADFALQNQTPETGQKPLLSARELAVLLRISQGMTNKVIAHDLNCAEASVKMYVRSICQKLHAENRAHAVVKAKEQMLI